jgi:hypothetical protein
MGFSWQESFNPVAKFMIFDWGDKVDSDSDSDSPTPPGYIGWQAVTTTSYAGVNFIPPFRDYEFGYRFPKGG